MARRLLDGVDDTWQPLAKNIFSPGGCWSVLLGINHPKNLNIYGKPRRFPPAPGRGYFWNLAAKRGHGLCFSTTGGGKNTNLITPALLSYNGSVLCLDPKGENAWITADRRRQLGQKVVILDPWDQVNKVYGSKAGKLERISRFNPLASLDPNSPDFNEDVTSIADGIIIVSEKSDPHWSDSASQLVSGLIAGVVERAPGVASFRDVRKLITAADGELIRAINNIVARNPNSLAGRKLRRFANATKEIQSIRSTAETQTAIFDAARLLDNMENVQAQERTRTSMIDAAQMLGTMETMSNEGDAFDLSELATSRVTLYLVLPFGMLASHGRWMRLILQLALKAIARQATPPHPPILFLLDELGTINPGGGLRMIEQAYGLLGAQGVRIWGFFQTLDQLQRDYPSTWQTFIGNSENISLMRLNDNGTSEYFSQKIGTTTTIGGSDIRILKPQDLETIPDNYVLTLRSGGDSVQMLTVPYFQESRFNGMYRPNPLYALPAWAKKAGTVSGPATSEPSLENTVGRFARLVRDRLNLALNGAPAAAPVPAYVPPAPAAPAAIAALPVSHPAPAATTVPAPAATPSAPWHSPYGNVSVNLSIGKGKS